MLDVPPSLTIPSPEAVVLRLKHPLPAHPFTRTWAERHGISRRVLGRLVQAGVVRTLLRGVYCDALLPDSTELRVQALSLVAPPGSVVCDWTACWYWTGMDQPNSHLVTPPPSVFRFRGHDRTRHDAVHSGERWLLAEDVIPLADGLMVTTPIRTAWDMGRFAHRYVAIGAMDALMRADGFTTDEMLAGLVRFRRQRGVVQLRMLAPLVDPRSESMGESAVRLHWWEIPGAPTPVPQVPVVVGGKHFRLDIGAEDRRYAAEYDGEEFHTSPEQKEHDAERREAVEQELGWVIDVFVKKDVFGQHADVDSRLGRGLVQAAASAHLR